MKLWKKIKNFKFRNGNKTGKKITFSPSRAMPKAAVSFALPMLVVAKCKVAILLTNELVEMKRIGREKSRKSVRDGGIIHHFPQFLGITLKKALSSHKL